MFNFYKLLFFNSMLISTFISISSISWFMIWMGLEMNLLSFIPLMKSYNKYSSESSIKYFIIQSIASMILLLSISLLFNNYHYWYTSLILDTSIFMKVGLAPLHFWLPEVMSGLSWKTNFLLMTWQKIAPYMILSYSMISFTYMFFFIISSSLISSIQGMNQICLRKIMAYSSINHNSWMIMAMYNSVSIWFIYFFIYSMMNFTIIFFFYKLNIFYFNQLYKLSSSNKFMKFFFMMNFLSLGGLPPFLGFLPKWLVIFFMINKNFYTLTFIMIILSLFPLFIYLRLTFSTLTLNSEESLIFYLKIKKFWMFFFSTMMIFSLSICMMYVNYL